MSSFIPTPGQVPPGWFEIPGYGWVFLDLTPVLTSLAWEIEALVGAAARALAEESAIMNQMAELGVIEPSYQAEYEVAVVYSTIEYVTMNWFDRVVDFVQNLYERFKWLLNVIHFKTLLAIHQVLMLVSPQYRALMNRISKTLAEYSKALGLGAGFVELALRNTRTLVMDATGALGKSYDMGQLTWLKELDGWMKKTAAQADRYAKNPFLIFTDLEEDVERAYANTRSNFNMSIFGTLEGLLKGLGEAAGLVDKVDRDLLKLLNDLPEFIKSQIDPAVFGMLRTVDSFIAAEFLPKMTQLNQIIVQQGADIRAAQKTAADAAARILTPKQTMLALPTLSEAEQDEALHALDALSARRSLDVQTRIAAWSKPTFDEFERLVHLLLPTKPPPAFLTLEHSLAPVPSLTAPVVSRGPFVGDY